MPLSEDSVAASVAYLSQVLGVDAFILPRDFEAAAAAPAPSLSTSSVAPMAAETSAASSVSTSVSNSVSTSMATFVSPAPAVSSVAEPVVFGPRDADLVFVSFNQADANQAWDAEGVDLWQRMVVAMKRDPAHVLRVGFDIASLTAARELLAQSPRAAIVILGAETGAVILDQEGPNLGQWIGAISSAPAIVTHSLVDVLRDPNLKRAVWQHLQMVMKRLT